MEIIEHSNFSTTEFLLSDDSAKEAPGDQNEAVKKYDQLDIASTIIIVKGIKIY